MGIQKLEVGNRISRTGKQELGHGKQEIKKMEMGYWNGALNAGHRDWK